MGQDPSFTASRKAETTASRYLLLSGEPIVEPIVGSGPFVMNTAEEIRQAHQEFREGKLGQME